MNIDSLVRMASPKDVVGTLMLKKGLDQTAAQFAQLLQALPAAPQPAHLGNGVDVLA